MGYTHCCLQPLSPPPEGDASLPYDISNLRNYSLAVTGDVFRWIVDYAPPKVLQRVCTGTSARNYHTNDADACSWRGICQNEPR